ncbi:MAG: hypothetical protein KDB53_07155 [Planctomycetes bacterium]|nr:hypothetical protein [Planctomycetota bacterium]
MNDAVQRDVVAGSPSMRWMRNGLPWAGDLSPAISATPGLVGTTRRISLDQAKAN